MCFAGRGRRLLPDMTRSETFLGVLDVCIYVIPHRVILRCVYFISRSETNDCPAELKCNYGFARSDDCGRMGIDRDISHANLHIHICPPAIRTTRRRSSRALSALAILTLLLLFGWAINFHVHRVHRSSSAAPSAIFVLSQSVYTRDVCEFIYFIFVDGGFRVETT